MSEETTQGPTELLRAVHAAMQAGDLDRVAEFRAADAVDHGARDGSVPGSPEHVAEWDRRGRAFRGSISDFSVTVVHSVEHGDTVGQLMIARGAMNGVRIESAGIHIVRVRGGRIVEHWAVFEGEGQPVASPSPAEVLRGATESFVAGFPADAPDFVAPGAVDHSQPADPAEAWEGRRRALRARMSGVSVSIEKSIESGDTVGQLILTTGSLDGRPFRFRGFHIVRVRAGKIVEHWAVTDLGETAPVQLLAPGQEDVQDS